LAEKRVSYGRRIVGPHEGPIEANDLFRPELPALVDESFALSDSTIIVEYLEDTFPKPALRPAEARGRAVLRAAMRRIDEELTAPFERVEARVVTPELRKSMEDALQPWERRIGDNGLLLGMEFSLADAWLFAAMEKAALYDIQPSLHAKNLRAWLSRIRERETLKDERLTPAEP
jgi:glutathione S-transferase